MKNKIKISLSICLFFTALVSMNSQVIDEGGSSNRAKPVRINCIDPVIGEHTGYGNTCNPFSDGSCVWNVC